MRGFLLACMLLAVCAGSSFLERTSGLAAQAPAATNHYETGHFDHAAFKEEWGNEWRHGNFPSYKKTQKPTYFKARDFQDSQSDGKPSPGLTGPDVGAYLPSKLPRS
mmetsp:Transcript_114664/g.370520  ORF Transcript_114664/g.370520 Transcript_114664/m.370520 type:complete len:107 (+) Transcript_114664:74-394(+)